MYQVLGNIHSRAKRIVWMLEEIGQPYNHASVNPRSPEVLAVNPSGKIPVLLDAGRALTDSTAILTFLADKHGALTHPPGSYDRAVQDGHTHFLLDEMDALLWQAAKHSFILPKEQRVPEIKPSLRAEFQTSCAHLAARIGGDFLQGGTMTIADIVAVHCLDWALSAKFDISEPKVIAYRDRLAARPAYKAASAV
jgi:glutathione S-transferase